MGLFVALLKGINVGGKKRLPMAKLRAAAEAAGLSEAETYLASGNLILEADGAAEDLATSLRAAVIAAGGPDVAVFVLPATLVRRAESACPFNADDPRHIHAALAAGDLLPDADVIARLKRPDEALLPDGALAWLHTPSGAAGSKLLAGLDRALGRDVTARNLRTIRALVQMLDGRDAT